jgi:glutamine synthetase
MVAAGAKSEALTRCVHETPIIDNHAHPLLKPSARAKHPLLAIATEASGDALASTFSSLAHVRAVNQLSRVLGCEPTWDAVRGAIAARWEGDMDGWTRRCLRGIHTVLVDDGLDGDDALPYDFFDGVTPGSSKRIVRIEFVVPGFIEEACAEFGGDGAAAWGRFVQRLRDYIDDALRDREVVGFKSVICYRTGLAIPRDADEETALRVFEGIHRARTAPGAAAFKRIDHPGLNEFIVHTLAGAIQGWQGQFRKPIQFHTGLGDNDITLTSSSPAHMQRFIEAYPDVPFVLLHSGYPFTRELGYLAAMYKNAYADIGEVFPFLSRDGQAGVVRQILELCPGEKILWSTDGHWFPETYFLAVEQVREVLDAVLQDYVRRGDLTLGQAIRLTEDVFYNNSNKLYSLGLEEVRREVGDSAEAGLDEGGSERSLALLSRHLEAGEPPRFLGIYWNDMTATVRMRAVPIRRVLSMLSGGEELSFGVTKAGLGLTQLDTPAEGVSPSGEYRLHPDLGTLRAGPKKGYLSARGVFKESDGSAVALCPRTTLIKALDAAKAHGLTFTLGFEIELVLMKVSEDGDTLEPLDKHGHAWSVARAMDHEAASKVIEPAIAALDEAGIYIDMVHPESAPGQYEVVLPKAPALQAVDTLLFARDVLSSHATAAGYRMTLHPKPFAAACGTAAHVHISLQRADESEGEEKEEDDVPAEVYEPFYAGVLAHLRAIAAFTYSSAASYERVVDGVWAGGTYISWGGQNRETPLRKIAGSHWEVKCMDGIANPYLALAAVVSAGVMGVREGRELAWRDCGTRAPAALTQGERDALGIVSRFPGSLEDALDELRSDGELVGELGAELVERYVAVKEAELKLLTDMDGEMRKRWIMERY